MSMMDKSSIEKLLDGEESQAKIVASNQYLFHLGDDCNHYVFVRSGEVRVELLSTTGQQLLLYRISDGQSCVMTTACLLGASRYFAQFVTEAQVDLMLLPASVFRLRLAESPEFRDIVFDGFSQRLAALMQRTAELATYSVDQRLAAVLLVHASLRASGGVIINPTRRSGCQIPATSLG